MINIGTMYDSTVKPAATASLQEPRFKTDCLTATAQKQISPKHAPKLQHLA
ncbi:hypothetical protein N9913_00920 [Porticoccaceae bacterium]|nr:hypothetical protein [Porticoccaceae bacterium]MDB4076917.1 hypothetical protein [Porticoccaceae bacterium]MDB4308851.1 hypothetical protein [Porticoccaceae bacterium]MDC0003673.1 hypothetical protein [Porticoccaceae bacterium]